MERRALSVFLTVTLSVFAESCATVTQAPLSIQEDPHQFIRIEARYGDEQRQGAHRFEHPLTLSSGEWERILTSIQVQSRKDTFIFTREKNLVEAAFSPAQIAFLASGLSRSFARAHPDEFVVFGFRQDRSLPLTEITTGGWFVQDDRLHLILANYRHSVTMSTIREQLWKDPLHSNSTPSYALVPGAYQSEGPDKGLAGLLSAEAQELLMDYKSSLASQPTFQGPAMSASPGGKDMRPQESVEERLRVLKDLRDKGLITEEEYRNKKKELLDRF